MERKKLFDQTCEHLSGIYPPEEARAMTFILFEAFFSLNKVELLLNPTEDIQSDIKSFNSALNELLNHHPFQYVLGETEFFGLSFKVDENVLIPRPETEELVKWIIDASDKSRLKVLDIGTGSGAIAVSLAKKLSGSMVSAIDISPEALKIAAENAGRNGVEISFSNVDILTEIPAGKFDIIVSNPPYVRELEKEEMRKNVLGYEPETALFVPDNDPLLFYRRITEISRDLLEDNGVLYFEINEAFGKETVDLMEKSGFHDVELREDMFDRDRMVRGIWK